MALLIRAFPRLHFSLIDLSRTGYRMYGGIGASIDAFPIELTFEACPIVDLQILRSSEYARGDIEKLERRLTSAMEKRDLKLGVRLVEAHGVLLHVGLGTGTRVALSCVEALFRLNDVWIDETELKWLSGRGGASGQGLHTYFHGGLCLDIGKKRDGLDFLSSDSQDTLCSLPTTVGAIPKIIWPLVVVVPKVSGKVSVLAESKYFASATPIEDIAVFEAAYVALFGIYGGALDEDYKAFCHGLNRLQQLPWKSGETALHGSELQQRIELARQEGADAVIMSSIGPTFACASLQPELLALRLISRFDDATVVVTNVRSQGREISNA